MNALTQVQFWTGIALGVGAGLICNKFINNSSTVNQDDDDDEWEDDEDSEYETDSEDEEGEVKDVASREPVKMVLVVRNDLKMGKGKASAQCAHAAVAAYKQAVKKAPKVLRAYERHGTPKVVVKVDTEVDLLTVYATAQSLNLVTSIIQDAGRTQIAAGSRTVVAVGPGPESLIDQVTGQLKLY